MWTELLSTSAEADQNTSGGNSSLVPLFACLAIGGVWYGLYQRRKAQLALLWREYDPEEEEE